MKAIITGIMTLFNAGGSFYNDVSGRLYYGQAPDDTSLSDGPYAIFFPVSDVDDDTFTDTMKEFYIQFSLFSGESSPATIMDMDKDLTSMFKNKTFSATGWTVINMKRVNGSGPLYNAADVEAGTGFYWQSDIDYIITVTA
jgi:hypothetical protein